MPPSRVDLGSARRAHRLEVSQPADVDTARLPAPPTTAHRRLQADRLSDKRRDEGCCLRWRLEDDLSAVFLTPLLAVLDRPVSICRNRSEMSSPYPPLHDLEAEMSATALSRCGGWCPWCRSTRAPRGDRGLPVATKRPHTKERNDASYARHGGAHSRSLLRFADQQPPTIEG